MNDRYTWFFSYNGHDLSLTLNQMSGEVYGIIVNCKNCGLEFKTNSGWIGVNHDAFHSVMLIVKVYSSCHIMKLNLASSILSQ